MENEIMNRVNQSSLIQLDLEDWYDHRKRMDFDLADYLYERLILRELDFRAALKVFDWTVFKDVHLAIHCSVDAIVPTWAFMLVANAAAMHAASVNFCSLENLDAFLFDRWIHALDLAPYQDQKVIIKGCSKFPVPVSAYVCITARLTPVVQSLMFGEPCSNVPIFKRKKI